MRPHVAAQEPAGSILVSAEGADQRVFCVLGWRDSLHQLYQRAANQPMFITFFPFFDHLVYDGLLIGPNVPRGLRTLEQCRRIYQSALSSNKVIFTLPLQTPVPPAGKYWCSEGDLDLLRLV